MAIYTSLPVYGAIYQLLLQLSRLDQHMQRDYRYTLAQDVKRRLTDVLVMVYRANRIRDKQPVITSMREMMVEICVYLRLLCDLRQLSEGQYLALAQTANSVGRQLAAWEKSVGGAVAPTGRTAYNGEEKNEHEGLNDGK